MDQCNCVRVYCGHVLSAFYVGTPVSLPPLMMCVEGWGPNELLVMQKHIYAYVPNGFKEPKAAVSTGNNTARFILLRGKWWDEGWGKGR